MSRYFLAIGSLAILGLACSLGASDASEPESSEDSPGSGGVPISKATSVPVGESDEAPAQEPQPSSPLEPTQSAPTESLPTAESAPPENPDLASRALQLVDLNVIDEGGGRAMVVGLVRNTTQNAMGLGDIYFTFLDESGQEVESRSTITTMFFIPPGEISTFRKSFPPNIPTGTEYVVVDTGFRDPPSSVQYTRDGLEFTPTGETVFPSISYTASVDVRNLTGKLITSLHVVAIAYDANGKILGFGESLWDTDSLEPGGSLSFEILIGTGPVTDQVERIEFIADARIEEP